MPENTLLIDVERVVIFLDNNQLVQAHGVLAKVTNAIEDVISRDIKSLKPTNGLTPEEQHPLWHAFREAYRIKALILAGNTHDSAARARRMREVVLEHCQLGRIEPKGMT